MSRIGALARALVGRRWRWVTLAVLALMAVLARLGVWQLDRLAERRAANAQLAAALASSYIFVNEDVTAQAGQPPAATDPDLANRDVFLTGEYDFAQQRILKLQNWEGQPGVHLITPLVLESGAAVLVDRGWIPDAEYEAGHAFDEATGPQTVSGYIALTETLRRAAAGAAEPGVELFRVDVAAIAGQLPYPLAPYYVRLAPQSEPDTTLPVAIAKEIDLSEGSHLSYAVQWFIFSLGLGVGYVLYVNRWLSQQEAEKKNPQITQITQI
ncbi:SURF1 family protein [Promineifilum sp.]|uniref:SURF1 family protein n=1 Tax=Promineifilum sp. TaxID=2664178 RepID=UPI0035B3F763